MKINFTKTKLNNKVTSITGTFFLFTGFLLATGTKTQAQIINTIAGNGSQSYGGDGQAATYASLYLPQGVAVDTAGNVYIADTWNSRIRKVNPTTGIITTYAGNGNAGYSGDKGAATSAEIDHPIGITVDDTGNVYFTDNANNVVREVRKSTGIITTIAGNGMTGFSGDGGLASSNTVEFSSPFGIKLDDTGNIYIADEVNSRIREIKKSTGIITTIAGNGVNGFSGDNGPATAAEFFFPTDIAVDTSGNIYIADGVKNNRIRKITASTDIVTTVAGTGVTGFSGNGGPATSAEFDLPAYLALDDSGNVYIADLFNAEVRKLTVSTGIVSDVAGDTVGGFSGDGGPADSAELNEPSGVALDVCGNVYICERGNARIRKVTVSGSAPTNSIISTTTTICPGQSVSFRDSTNFYATKWTWSFFGGTPDTSTSSNPVITYDKTGTFYLTVNASNTCYSVFNTFINYVKVVAPPALTIVPPSATVCKGQGVTLEVSSKGSGFTWSPSTGLNTTTGDSVISTPLATVTYTVSGTDSTGCTATGTSVVTLGISPNKPTFTQHDDTLISSSKNDNQWYRNDTLLTNDTSQVLIITALGEYWVVVGNEANGCSTASDSMNISSLTGVNQLSVVSEQLSVYPNPFSNDVFIKINSSADISDWNLTITDVLGQTLFTTTPLNPLKGTFEIDLSNLSGGIYFITVVNKTGRAVFPVVKQN